MTASEGGCPFRRGPKKLGGVYQEAQGPTRVIWHGHRRPYGYAIAQSQTKPMRLNFGIVSARFLNQTERDLGQRASRLFRRADDFVARCDFQHIGVRDIGNDRDRQDPHF